jgi:hypothetical protein
MTNTFCEEILTGLGLVLLERLPHGIFLRVGRGEPPEWFRHVMLSGKENEPVTVAEAMPFVGEFLDSAESFWREGQNGRLRSEAFTIVDSRGTEIGLVASALVVGHRHLLAIELSADYDERRRALQTARENVLEHDEHVRRTGALLTPLAAVRGLADRLAASGLTADQEALSTAIREQLTALAGSIQTLAPLPKGVRRARS